MGSRGLWIALFVSAAVNVFGVGALVGAYLRETHTPPAPATPPQGEGRPRNPVMAAVRSLPPASQAAWQTGTPAFAAANGPKVQEARQLVRETMGRFGDEPFDQAAILADLQKARALEHEGRLAMDRRIVSFAATLPPAERAQFGEALSRPPMRRPGIAERERP